MSYIIVAKLNWPVGVIPAGKMEPMQRVLETSIRLALGRDHISNRADHASHCSFVQCSQRTASLINLRSFDGQNGLTLRYAFFSESELARVKWDTIWQSAASIKVGGCQRDGYSVATTVQ
jgi:hypothetical protein